MPGGRYLQYLDDSGMRYQGLMAGFGDQLPEREVFNVMYPPTWEDRYLCDYPDFGVLNYTEQEVADRVNKMNHSIALLVPRVAPCPNQQKAEVMKRMQERISEKLKLLLLYETDRSYSGFFLLLLPDADTLREYDYPVEELESVGVMYVPYMEKQRLTSVMEKVRDEKSNHFLRPGNENWAFYHSVQGYWTPPSVNNRAGSAENYDKYEWFRYVLFFLLILFPCVAYARGGRLLIRRNDEGRFIGFQYIPPMPIWLAHGGSPPQPEPVKNTLTSPEFEALPQISFDSEMHKDPSEDFLAPTVNDDIELCEKTEPNVETSSLKLTLSDTFHGENKTFSADREDFDEGEDALAAKDSATPLSPPMKD